MKTKQQLKIGLALFSAVFFLSFTSLKADVVGFVEDHKATENFKSFHKPIVTPNGKFFYAIGNLGNLNYKLIAYSRDLESGKLTEIESIKPALSVNEYFHRGDIMAVSPNGKQLYVTTSYRVQQYKINDSGKLTFINSVVSKGGEGIVIRKDGKNLYVTGGYSITVIRRANNGNLTVLNRYKADLYGQNLVGFNKLVLSPDGKQLYASGDGLSARLYVFDIKNDEIRNTQYFINKDYYNANNFTSEATKIEGAGGNGIVVSNDGKFVYTAGRNYTSVRHSMSMFKRELSGKLSFIKNIKAPSVSSDNKNPIIYSLTADLAINKNSKYIYSYDTIMKVLGVWERDSLTGDLAYLGKVTKEHRSSVNDVRLYASPDGRNLYLNIDDVEPFITIYDLRADLGLVKSGPSGDVAPNGTMSYTLAVTNNGLSDAQNVVVTDNLPAGTSFISGTNNNTNDKCIASGQKVTCKMGKILSGHDFNAIIQVKAPANEGNITNTATVTSDQLDTVTANNTDTAKSTIKKGGSSLPPVKDGGSKGGGSLPLGLLLLLIPALLRRARVVS